MDKYGYWGLVSCYDWYETNDKAWFCLSDKNAICEMNKHNGKINILGRFPNKPLNKKGLSMSVVESKGQLIFAPFSADDIAVYDIKERKIRFYPVEIKSIGKKVTYLENEKFFRMIIYGDYIFLVGRTTPVIARFCVNSGNLEYFDEWLRVIDAASQEGCVNAYFADGYAFIKGYLYIGLSCTNGVLKINPKTMEWEFEKIECGLSGFGGLLQTDDEVWLSGIQYNENILLRMNLKTKQNDEIKIPYNGIYLSPFCFGDGIYLSPITEQRLYRYSIKNAVWSEVQGIGNNRNIDNRENRIVAWKTDNYGVTLIMGNNRKWKRLGCDDTCIEDYIVEIGNEGFMEECCREVMRENVIIESDFSLTNFIAYMKEFSEKNRTFKQGRVPELLSRAKKIKDGDIYWI